MTRFFLLFFGFLPIYGFTQQKTSILLDTIQLHNNYTFELTRKIPTEAKNFTQELEQKTPIFIKDYGAGNLATLTYQGTSSSQNSLYWKNINLNPVNVGTTDFSLIDGFLFDSYSFQTSKNMLQGSGIGSDLVLTNKIKVDSGISILHKIQTGSFKDFQFGSKINLANNKYVLGMSLVLNRAENDFRFYNVTTKIFENRQNNQNRSFANRVYFYKWIKKGYLNIESWNKTSNRNISSPILVQNQNENQKDQFSRTSLELTLGLKNGITYTQNLAVIVEGYQYQNPSSKIFGDGSFYRYVSVSSFKKRFNSLFNSELTVFGESVFAEVSDLNKKRFMLGFAFKNELQVSKHLHLVASTRKEEYLAVNGLPLTYDLRLNFSRKKINCYVKASKNARIPTLNDLFWANGGNTNLKSELSKTAYLGIKKSGVFGFSAEGFLGTISNMIIWLPNSENGLWTPLNVFAVKRFGTTIEANYRLNIKQITVEMGAIYTYTHSVESSTNKQLIFTPINTVKYWAAFLFSKKIILNYGFQWVDKRYVTRDYSASLPSFTVSDASISKTWKIKNKTLCKLHAECKNIFGYTYYNIPFRPMPRRYVGIGLELTY